MPCGSARRSGLNPPRAEGRRLSGDGSTGSFVRQAEAGDSTGLTRAAYASCTTLSTVCLGERYLRVV